MTSRRRVLAALALAGALTTSVAACGSDEGATATDTSPTTGPTTATADPTPSAPTVAPEPGSLPDFPYTDYAYTLGQQCFCADIDQTYRVTVVDGEVSSLTWATEGDGHQVGDPLDEDYLNLTIQDIIDQGNDTSAAEVEVDWPAGQAYPSSVYIDQDKMIADEEVTWLISDVEVA